MTSHSLCCSIQEGKNISFFLWLHLGAVQRSWHYCLGALHNLFLNWFPQSAMFQCPWELVYIMIGYICVIQKAIHFHILECQLVRIYAYMASIAKIGLLQVMPLNYMSQHCCRTKMAIPKQCLLSSIVTPLFF